MKSDNNVTNDITKYDIPIYRKMNLTVKEAAAYSNIGENKIREMVTMPHCPFLLMSGRNILIKRQAFEEYIARKETI